MGRAIERAALDRGHEIVARIDVDNRGSMDSPAFRSADVAIEFTAPAAAMENVREALRLGVPVVSGSTGWNKGVEELGAMVRQSGEGAFFYSSNYSIGMYLFRKTNIYLAQLMRRFGQYSPEMEEIHHIHKIDHPSGTAVTLAGELLHAHGGMKGWQERCLTFEGEVRECAAVPEGTLPVDVRREGEVPGIHTVRWSSDCDSISITHSARGRQGFAEGAVVAAEWLKGRQGFFGMDDMMNEIMNGND